MAVPGAPRDTAGAVEWMAHLAYLAVIGVLYFNNAEVIGVLRPWQWALQLILLPLVVFAVVARKRLPFLLPLVGVGTLVLGVDAVTVVGMLSLSLRRTGPRVWALGAIGAAIRVLTLVPAIRPVDSEADWAVMALFAVLYTGVLPVLVGAYIRAHRRLEASVAERAVRAEVDRERTGREAAAAERDRIAQEMHDSVGHVLALITMQAGALEVSSGEPATVAAAEAIRRSARTGLADLRAVVRALGEDARRDPAPDHTAIPRLVEASRSAGAVVEFADRAAPDRSGLAASVGRLLYRAVQEALTNAHRHAPGAAVSIVLSGAPGRGVRLTVRNPLSPGGERGAGTGLAALRNRVAVLDGTFDAHAAQGFFELDVELPWEEES